jgi:hypothetical protein
MFSGGKKLRANGCWAGRKEGGRGIGVRISGDVLRRRGVFSECPLTRRPIHISLPPTLLPQAVTNIVPLPRIRHLLSAQYCTVRIPWRPYFMPLIMPESSPTNSGNVKHREDYSAPASGRRAPFGGPPLRSLADDAAARVEIYSACMDYGKATGGSRGRSLVTDRAYDRYSACGVSRTEHLHREWLSRPYSQAFSNNVARRLPSPVH